MTERTKLSPRRIGGIITALGVGSIAAIASFAHIRELAIDHGQSRDIGTLYPLSVDWLIIGATFAMNGHRKFWPRVAFFAGVAATISGNILAVPGDALSRVISAWPAIALLLVVEILVPRAPKVAPQTAPAVEPEPVVDPVEPEPVKTPAAKPYVAPKTARKVAASVKRNPTARPTEIAAKTGLSETTVRRAIAATDLPALTVVKDLRTAPAVSDTEAMEATA
jgi:uncharacterized protein DUF2637